MTDVIQENIRIGNCFGNHDFADSRLKFRYIPDSFKSVWDSSERLSRFVASYYSLFPSGKDFQTILFIINEILENAIKNNPDPSLPIEIEMYQKEEGAVLVVTNELTEEKYRSFMEYALTFDHSDLLETYRTTLEDMHSGNATHGIGLILLKKDHHVDLCFEFNAREGRHWVSVYIHL